MATPDIITFVHHPTSLHLPTRACAEKCVGLRELDFRKLASCLRKLFPRPFTPTHQLNHTQRLIKATVSECAYVQVSTCLPHISLTLTIVKNQLLFQTTHVSALKLHTRVTLCNPSSININFSSAHGMVILQRKKKGQESFIHQTGEAAIKTQFCAFPNMTD